MAYQNILYATDAGVATITLNRPAYKNAQSYDLLDEVDAAFAEAGADPAVKVVVLRGAGGNFSAGHDLGTPETVDRIAAMRVADGSDWYGNFKKYNLDLLLKWRAFPKPTIAMVDGYCIYGGWMLAAAMDIVFAASEAKFLGGVVEYMSIPWDLGVRQAKEICFESRFITAEEARQHGFVNRVFDPADLERETIAYARRVSENTLAHLRFSKQMLNRAQDVQGFTNAVEGALTEFVALLHLPNQSAMGLDESGRRLKIVDLALRGQRGDRPGLAPNPTEPLGATTAPLPRKV